VIDSGIGISPHGVRRLFKSFSQVDSSTSRKYGGTGLGLAICKRLCDLMDGRIWVESREGEGSTFHFTTHVLRERQRAGDGDTLSELAGLRVLVVDDSDASRASLRTQTRSWGMEPVEAARGEVALAKFEAGEVFDVILIDQGLGEQDGIEFAQTIASQLGAQYPPLILLKSGNRPVQIAGTPLSGALSKPARERNLQTAILDALKRGKTAKPLQTEPQPADAVCASSKSLRILLAEDNRINQKVAVSLLARLGCEADVAANGREALERMRESVYDLVLMDMQMPEMDGIEATERIRSEFPPQQQPRIVAMTANALEADRKICLDAGMDDYLAKPVKLEVLTAVLDDCARIPST